MQSRTSLTVRTRLPAAMRAASLHLLCSLFAALLAAALVFGLWYPYPYRELSGGSELFFLVVSVDVICGPVLTLILFNPAKPSAELWRDLGLVALIQLCALGYGLNTVWQARPLFLVQEVDRFKVVMANDLDRTAVAALPAALQPDWRAGPIVVAIRDPKDNAEREKVMFAAVTGGPDYAERPEFYLPYEGGAALKSIRRAKPLQMFLTMWPEQGAAAGKLAAEKGVEIEKWLYLPIIARKSWVAVLNQQGQIQGFLPGDGF